MSLRVPLPIASPGPPANVIGVLGFVCILVWIGWRFGPTLARVSGWCAWSAGRNGSQGGYGYCAGFLVLETIAWGGETIWYARRRGRWRSPISVRPLERLPGLERRHG